MDCQKFKLILLEKKKTVQENIDRTQERLNDPNNRPESNGYSFHMADLGTDAMEKEQSFYFIQRAEKNLSRINEALERIEKGTFGICKACPEPHEINEERLTAVPTTEQCFQIKMAKKEKISTAGNVSVAPAY